MKRRDFIQQASAGTALVTLGSLGLQSFTSIANTTKITILHTNDVHSHIDTFEEGRNANKGGVARRASIVQSLRKENPLVFKPAPIVKEGNIADLLIFVLS